jgi:hypothetical protein
MSKKRFMFQKSNSESEQARGSNPNSFQNRMLPNMNFAEGQSFTYLYVSVWLSRAIVHCNLSIMLEEATFVAVRVFSSGLLCTCVVVIE